MQYYDLLSSEQRERIQNEILMDKMEEAEEIRNSLPNGSASYHDDNDFHDYEEERRQDEARREESNRREHRPYGRRFHNKNGNRRVGYNKQNNNREKDHIKYDKNGKPIVKSYAAAMGERARRKYEKENRDPRKSGFNPYANRHRRRSNSDEDLVNVGYSTKRRRTMKRKDFEEFRRKQRERLDSIKP